MLDLNVYLKSGHSRQSLHTTVSVYTGLVQYLLSFCLAQPDSCGQS